MRGRRACRGRVSVRERCFCQLWRPARPQRRRTRRRAARRAAAPHLTYAYSLTGRLSLEGRRKPTKALRRVGKSASRRAAHHVLVRRQSRAETVGRHTCRAGRRRQWRFTAPGDCLSYAYFLTGRLSLESRRVPRTPVQASTLNSHSHRGTSRARPRNTFGAEDEPLRIALWRARTGRETGKITDPTRRLSPCSCVGPSCRSARAPLFLPPGAPASTSSLQPSPSLRPAGASVGQRRRAHR
jgi:hypothetical protein